MSVKTQSFRFGDFLLDCEEKVLFRDEKPIAITPKAFLLLRTLVEKSGHLVEKDELMQAVWPDSFVEQGNLSFTVNVLRKGLGDNAHDPRFIETVPRRGYRFIAEIVETSVSGKSQEKPESPAVAKKSGRPSISFSRFAVFSLLFVLIIGVSWYAVGLTGNAHMQAPILNVPFKSEAISSSGDIRHAAISPDGNLVAYTGETGKKQNLWIRNLSTSENVQLIPPSEDHYLGLAFARDGSSLYFVRKSSEDNAVSSIYRIASFGGIPTKLIDRTEGWISVSPDNRQLSFVRCSYTENDYCSLFSADIDGKNERILVTKPRPSRISANQFSPDGQKIAFASGQSNNGQGDFQIFQVDLATGAESSITNRNFFNIKSLAWLPSGQEMLFTAMETLDGKGRIWRISERSRDAIPLTNDAVGYAAISLDKNAVRMVATSVSNSFRLNRTVDGKTTAFVAARRMSFSPNGDIIYQADDNNLWSMKPDGREQRQLTRDPASDSSPRVSPDGRLIYFSSNRSGSNQVWRMNADGTDQIQLTQNEGGQPTFVSADGKWIYYLSAHDLNLRKVSNEGNDDRLVKRTKMFEPTSSADGTKVAYFFRDERWYIGISNLESGEMIRTIDFANGKSPPIKISWSADSHTISFVTAVDSKYAVWQQRINEDAPRFFADLGNEQVEDFAFAPDGSSYATVIGKWTNDAVLIDGLK